MPDIKRHVEPFLAGEDEVREGIELLFFAYRDFIAEPDAILAQYGFGRAHHRGDRATEIHAREVATTASPIDYHDAAASPRHVTREPSSTPLH